MARTPTKLIVPAAEAKPTANTLIPVEAPPPAAGALAPLAPSPLTLQPTADTPTGPGTAALFRALRQRWLLAVTVALTSAAAVGAAAWVLLTPKATVRSSLLVSPTPPKIVFSTADNAPEAQANLTGYQKTQATLITSRFVLSAAVRQPRVAELPVVLEQSDPIEWLEKQLKVENPPGTDILHVTIKGNRSEELVTVVNAVTEAYLREVVEKERNKRRKRLHQLQEISDKAEEALRSKRVTLKEWAENAGSGDAVTLAVAHQFALEQLNAAKKDLMQYRSERRRLELELAAGTSDRPTAHAALSNSLTLQDLTTARHMQRLAELEEKAQRMKERSARGEAEPALRPLLSQIEAVKKTLAARRRELASQQAELARAEAKSEAERQKKRAQVLEHMETALVKEVNDLSKQTQGINKSSLDIVALKEQIAKDEVLAGKIAAEMEALKIEIQAPPRVTLLEGAGISWSGAGKKRIFGLGAGIFAALALSLFGVSYLELRARRITRPEDVVDHLGVRLVGAIPHVGRHESRRRLGGPEDALAPVDRKLLTESVDAARTMLLHAARVDSLRVVMVTSALGGEGKTSLACHLAASLARAGRKTLLVDCDLRKPAAHSVFDMPQGPGFGALLLGAAEPGDVVKPTALPGLWLMTAGEPDEGAVRELAREGAQQVFARLREEFDFIILDSPPVLPVADSLLLAQFADGVLFSLLRHVSRVPTTNAALKKMEALGVRILGAVVSGAHNELASYGPYY